jgi:polysaccharide export outer membrane protein
VTLPFVLFRKRLAPLWLALALTTFCAVAEAQPPTFAAPGAVWPRTPAQPFAGVDSAMDGVQGSCGELQWEHMRPIPWQYFAQGEYVGMARTQHVQVYRLRVDDQLEFVYRLTREVMTGAYHLEVGDTLRLESFTDARLDRELLVQPDGTVTLRLLGQIPAAGRTVQELRDEIERLYLKYYKVPAITLTPLQLNTRLEDLRATVDARAGQGGQRITVRVTPEGTVQLPALGSVFVQGLSLDEVKREVDARYAATIQGIAVTPILLARAPRYIYVVGEVTQPGRFALEGPTTVMQGIALAGGWNPAGGNIRQVVVFRRGPDWRLMATMLDLRGALLGKRPCPADEIWLNDSDIIVVPKTPLKMADDVIEQLFTRGLYGIAPFSGSYSFTKSTTLLR